MKFVYVVRDDTGDPDAFNGEQAVEATNIAEAAKKANNNWGDQVVSVRLDEAAA